MRAAPPRRLARRGARRAGDALAILHDLASETLARGLVGLTFAVYTGQEFERTQIQPEMIGHYLGEFQLTRSSVEHGQAGIGATRSSKFVPLK